MRNINFNINNFVIETKSPTFKSRVEDRGIYILGDLIGFIENKNVFNSEKTFQLIVENYLNDRFIKNIMKKSIGSFYLIIENGSKINIYCSCTSPGLLYAKNKNKIFFSSSENQFYAKHFDLNQLDEMELMSQLISHPIFRRVPFKGLFKHICRSPSGSSLEIDKNLNIKKKIFLVNSFIKEKNNAEYSIREKTRKFSFLIEKIIKLTLDYYKNKKIVLLKSGGIDSSALLAALCRNKKKFEAYNFCHQGLQSEVVDLAKKIVSDTNNKLNILYPKTIDYKEVLSDAKINLNSLVGIQYLKMGSHNLSDKNDCIALSGQNLDTLYYSDTFGPHSMEVGIEKLKAHIFGFKKRFFYSYFFLKKSNNFFLKKTIQFISKRNDFNFNDFLESILIANTEHVIPFKKKNYRGLKDSLNILYVKYRRENLLNIVKEYCISTYSNNLEELTPEQKNHIIRLARWLRTVHNVPSNYHLSNHKSFNRVLPFTEGPMVNFFMTYKLSLYEMIFLKVLVKRYFRSFTNKDHYFYALSTKIISFFKLMKEKSLLAWIFNKIFKKRKNIDIENYESELATFRTMYIQNGSDILINNCSNITIKNYLESIKDNLFNLDKRDWTKSDLMELSRFINFEIYFSHHHDLHKNAT